MALKQSLLVTALFVARFSCEGMFTSCGKSRNSTNMTQLLGSLQL